MRYMITLGGDPEFEIISSELFDVSEIRNLISKKNQEVVLCV